LGENAGLITLYSVYAIIYKYLRRLRTVSPPPHDFGPVTLASQMGNPLCFLPEITIIYIIIIQREAIYTYLQLCNNLHLFFQIIIYYPQLVVYMLYSLGTTATVC